MWPGLATLPQHPVFAGFTTPHASPAGAKTSTGAASSTARVGHGSLLDNLPQLPKQVQRDYPPLMNHFLKHCAIYAIVDRAGVEQHGTQDCRRLLAVVDFENDEGRLNLDKLIMFEHFASCYVRWGPYWVCQGRDRKNCSHSDGEHRRLVNASLSLTWWLQTDSVVCRRTLDAAGAPRKASLGDFRAWLGRYADPNAGQHKWISNATVLVMSLWSRLLENAPTPWAM